MTTMQTTQQQQQQQQREGGGRHHHHHHHHHRNQYQKQFETGHSDQIHDCQYDYYGRVRVVCVERRIIIENREIDSIRRLFFDDDDLFFLSFSRANEKQQLCKE